VAAEPGHRVRHLAIIMDGNGRWAVRRGLPRVAGHRAGIEALRRVVRACPDLGIDVLTVYAFSTENWRRPPDEGVCIRTSGDIGALPERSRVALAEAMAATAGETRLILNLALNYGGRHEIVRACRKLAAEVKAGRLEPDAIDEARFADALDTAGLPEPDLLIRASGEERLSNFLLWQLAYTEIWVTDTLWPDFGVAELEEALADFRRRDRRYGGLK
jgi:undecaprenyl diphosphate synthase